jgi:hypothetical protein
MHHRANGLRFIDRYHDHPIPDTLDSAAACMPEGWFVSIMQMCVEPYRWCASGRPKGQREVREDDPCEYADTEKEARFALALAARKAMKGTP